MRAPKIRPYRTSWRISAAAYQRLARMRRLDWIKQQRRPAKTRSPQALGFSSRYYPDLTDLMPWA